MSKCAICGGTKDLMKRDWMGDKYKCQPCSEKLYYTIVTEKPVATEEWLQMAKEVNGRIAAKYAR